MSHDMLPSPTPVTEVYDSKDIRWHFARHWCEGLTSEPLNYNVCDTAYTYPMSRWEVLYNGTNAS